MVEASVLRDRREAEDGAEGAARKAERRRRRQPAPLTP